MSETSLVWILASAFIGVIIRFLLGLQKAYKDKTLKQIDWNKVLLEAVYGILGGLVIVYGREWIPGLPRLPDWLLAGICGIFTADIVNTIRKKFGVEKTDFSLPMKHSDLSERQQRAFALAGTRPISNDDYQTINKVSDSTAQRELKEMVSKGLLVMQGKKKGIKYKRA